MEGKKAEKNQTIIMKINLRSVEYNYELRRCFFTFLNMIHDNSRNNDGYK